MDFINRNALPKFQERLDLAASDLNALEDIFCAALNELAGRLYIINNVVTDPTERAKYATEPNYSIVDKINSFESTLTQIQSDFNELSESVNTTLQTMDDRYTELERRFNSLDDAAARQKDLNAVLYRTGRE